MKESDNRETIDATCTRVRTHAHAPLFRSTNGTPLASRMSRSFCRSAACPPASAHSRHSRAPRCTTSDSNAVKRSLSVNSHTPSRCADESANATPTN